MRIFRTEVFFHCVNFLEQLIDQFEISFLVGLLHLATEFLYIAIGLSLGLVAADDCHDILRVILAHLGGAPTLSLRVRRYGGDQQNGNKYLHVY